jgi:hypothetical protein
MHVNYMPQAAAFHLNGISHCKRRAISDVQLSGVNQLSQAHGDRMHAIQPDPASDCSIEWGVSRRTVHPLSGHAYQ